MLFGKFMKGAVKNRILILLGLLSLCVTLIIFAVGKFMYSVIEAKSFSAMINSTTEMMEITRDVLISDLVLRMDKEKAYIANCASLYGSRLLDERGWDNTHVILERIPLTPHGLDYVFHGKDGRLASGRGTDPAFYTQGLGAAWSGKTVVDGPCFRGDGGYTMGISAPVYQNGEVKGVLTIVLDGFCLSEWISDLQFSIGNGMAYIINADGTNIATSTKYNRDWITMEYNAQELARTDELSKTIADLEIQPLKGLTGTGSYIWEGSRNYLVYAPVPGTGWGLFVGFYGELLREYSREITTGGVSKNQAYLAALILFLFILSIAEIRLIGIGRRDNHRLTKQKEELLALHKKAEEQSVMLRKHHETILASLEYAKKIQGNLLPDKQTCQGPLSDLGLIWKPKEAVGGDLYWIKHFTQGSLICVCDCTGHGVPGAMLTVLVATALEAIVEEDNYQDPAEIMWLLDQKLASVLYVHTEDGDKRRGMLNINDGADLALIYIDKDNAAVFSSGNIHVFMCNGEEVLDFKGQRLHIGEGTLKTKQQVKTMSVSADSRNRYYVASDGYFDQIGGEKRIPFGYSQFKKMILKHHTDSMDAVMDRLWEAFEQYRGTEERRDDVELVGFQA